MPAIRRGAWQECPLHVRRGGGLAEVEAEVEAEAEAEGEAEVEGEAEAEA